MVFVFSLHIYHLLIWCWKNLSSKPHCFRVWQYINVRSQLPCFSSLTTEPNTVSNEASLSMYCTINFKFSLQGLFSIITVFFLSKPSKSKIFCLAALVAVAVNTVNPVFLARVSFPLKVSIPQSEGLLIFLWCSPEKKQNVFSWVGQLELHLTTYVAPRCFANSNIFFSQKNCYFNLLKVDGSY